MALLEGALGCLSWYCCTCAVEFRPNKKRQCSFPHRITYYTPFHEIIALPKTNSKETTAHRGQYIFSGAAFVVCSGGVAAAVGEPVPPALDKTIVDTVAGGSAAEDAGMPLDGTTEFTGLPDAADVGVGVAAEEGESAFPGTFASSVGVALAAASEPPVAVDTLTVVLLAGLGVGRLLGNASALSPAQSA